MNSLKVNRWFVMVLFFIGLWLTASSCIVTSRHDNGNHKGWFKQSNGHHFKGNKPGKSKHN